MTEPTPDPELHPETRAIRGGRATSYQSHFP